jgi:hypothetical protein
LLFCHLISHPNDDPWQMTFCRKKQGLGSQGMRLDVSFWHFSDLRRCPI